jgi:class 3 adenylate cyclase
MTPRGKKWLDLADDWELLTENVSAMAFGFGYDESRPYAAFMRDAIDQETFRRFMSESIDLPGLAKQLRVPTLIVRHTGIKWLSMESTRALVAAIPDCRMVAIEGSYTDHPGQTGRALREFLAPDLPGASSASPETRRSVAQRPEPSSLRTVLFTDLVGHTEMMSRLSDKRGRDVLREHERITREVLKANGGTEVKTMGDGFMTSFGSVTRAVGCAVALQRAFAEREGEPLSVRVGLNAGEPIEEDGSSPKGLRSRCGSTK